MARLTKTQADLLEVLEAVRDRASETESADNARAIGGLTEREKFERASVAVRGYDKVGCHVPGGRAKAENVKEGTFWALQRARLIEVQDGRARALPAPQAPAITYRRIQHAAHYAYQDSRIGHDVEQWTYAQVDRRPRPAAIPADAGWLNGHTVRGVQHWTYQRTAPLSGPRCPRCPLATPKEA